MTCEQTGCDLDVFNRCLNHCSKNLCLQHVIEHGDLFVKNFTVALDHLEKNSRQLIDQVNLATSKIAQRRQFELDRINRFYDEKQYPLRQQYLFAERAERLIEEKSQQWTQSQNDSICHLGQHDFEQLKIYARQFDQYLATEEQKPTPSAIENDLNNSSSSSSSSSNRSCASSDWAAESQPRASLNSGYIACPLTRPNVFGVLAEHDVRCDCDGVARVKFTLQQHLEFYHRMLPECAIRLRDAVFAGQPITTPVFSPHETIKNDGYFVDCPLTDPNNVFGAIGAGRTLRHVPCTRKQLTLSSLRTHLNTYHRMTVDATKRLFHAIKNKKMPDDGILFEPDDVIGSFVQKT